MQTSNTSERKIGQRIAIVGCTGSGKSMLGKPLAKQAGLNYINSDALFWMPGWVQCPWPEFMEQLAGQLAGDRWVLDGNIDKRAHIVLPKIDTLIWLDYSRPTVMRRLLKRTLRRSWTGEEIFSGNRENWRMSFASKDSILLYAWRSHRERRQHYEALWPTLDPSITKHRVRTQAELDALLREAML
ncbi:MAG: adenylate kinase [Phycisphaeraceae bacterium]